MWSTSRKPPAGEFTFRGETVLVIANHSNSKRGDQSADGRFQFPAQSSAVQRAGQAQVVHDFVERILGVDRKAETRSCTSTPSTPTRRSDHDPQVVRVQP